MTADPALAPYPAGRPCPKCGRVRAAREPGPDWQCPGCGIAYAKFPAHQQAAAARAEQQRLLASLARDHSSWVLIAANLVALALAIRDGVRLHEMMLVYWLQSVAIGLSFYVRMRSLHRFSTEGLKMGDKPVAATETGKRAVATFFLFHYGFFHVAYLVFLLASSAASGPPSGNGLWLCAGTLVASHLYSLFENLEDDRRGTPNIGTLMMLPYARVLPMHLMIVFDAAFFDGPAAMLIFTLLKTAADVLMHLVEHRVLRAAPAQAAASS